MESLDRLERLQALRNSGALSEEEFQREKDRMFAEGNAADAATEPANLPRSRTRAIVFALLALLLVVGIALYAVLSRGDRGNGSNALAINPASPPQPLPSPNAVKVSGKTIPEGTDLAPKAISSDAQAENDGRSAGITVNPDTMPALAVPSDHHCVSRNWVVSDQSGPLWILTTRHYDREEENNDDAVEARVVGIPSTDSLVIVLPHGSDDELNPYVLSCGTDNIGHLVTHNHQRLRLVATSADRTSSL